MWIPENIFLLQIKLLSQKLIQLTPLSGKLEPLLEWTPNVGAPLSDMNNTIELWSIPFVLKADITSPTDWSNFDTIAVNKKQVSSVPIMKCGYFCSADFEVYYIIFLMTRNFA